MEIQDEKNRFLSLLRTSYQAESPNSGKGGIFEIDPCRIILSGNILEKFGFDYRDSSGVFWRVICPSLQADGYLTEYESFYPFGERYFLSNIREYTDLIEKRDSIALKLPSEYLPMAQRAASGRPHLPDRQQTIRGELAKDILSEIVRIGERLEEIKDARYGEMTHLFVIDEKKIATDEAKKSMGADSLRSIKLLRRSIADVDPIFAVLDERYEIPVRFAGSRNKGIRVLLDLSYPANAPGKSVKYSKRTSDTVNNDLFKNARIKDYMRSNGLRKPTLAMKSGGWLVLKSEVPVTQDIVEHAVPSQYRSLYLDKTR